MIRLCQDKPEIQFLKETQVHSKPISGIIVINGELIGLKLSISWRASVKTTGLNCMCE